MDRPLRHHTRRCLIGVGCLALATVASAATPATPPVPGSGRDPRYIEHALTVGRLPAFRGAEYRGIFLPPSVVFKARPDYLRDQDRQAFIQTAILSGARQGKADFAKDLILTTKPHDLRTGDRVEVLATGPAPAGLAVRDETSNERAFLFIRRLNDLSFFLHHNEADAHAGHDVIDLAAPFNGADPGTLHIVAPDLEKRVAPDFPGTPAWEGVLRQLKDILDSDAAARVKEDAKGAAMISLALRAESGLAYVEAQRLYNIYNQTNLSLPNPPVTLPEVLLHQAALLRKTGEMSAAVDKYYDAQKALLARPVSDDGLWRWLGLRARRGVADTLREDNLSGDTEDARQWARRGGALEVANMSAEATDAAKQSFLNVVDTLRPHGLTNGTPVRVLPMGTTFRELGVDTNTVLHVRVIGDKQLLLHKPAQPDQKTGVYLLLPEQGKVFLLPQTAPLTPLVEAVIPASPASADWGVAVFPRLFRLFGAAHMYRQLLADTEAASPDNSSFVGPRAADIAAWRLQWAQRADLEQLAKDLAQLLPRGVPVPKPEPDPTWEVLFDHLDDIFIRSIVPISSIHLDRLNDVLIKPKHGLKTGDPVRFSGALPGTANVRELDLNSILYVRTEALDKFTLHASSSEAVTGLNKIDFNSTVPFVTLVGVPFYEDATSQVLLSLSRQREEDRDYPLSQQYLAEYRQRYPDSPTLPEALLRQGYLFRLMGQPEMAIAKYYQTMTDATRLRARNLLKYRRTTLLAQAEIADTYYADLGQSDPANYDEAIKFYRQMLAEPDEELDAESTRYKLICCLVQRSMEQARRAQDAALLNAQPSLPRLRDNSFRELTAEATRFLIEHPKSHYRAQIRYLRALGHEQLGDEKNADRDLQTLIETPRSSATDEQAQWDFWKAKAGLDLANRFFDQRQYAVAASLYQLLLALNGSLESQVKLHQQMARCYANLGDLAQEQQAWDRVEQVWRHQQAAVQAQATALTALEKLGEMISGKLREGYLQQVAQQRLALEKAREVMTPELQVIVHVATARRDMAAFRNQLRAPNAEPSASAPISAAPKP
ncbi:MAG: hypothetical protein EXS22_04180 [Pedosphaera sp.]|nr:hypothetical protein [Pedosphaera sp.]MSU43225.1 hypothetical protein [Pedosphaera sp.]